MPEPRGLDILMLSIHGLIRGVAPELGRDADTGGQVLYVLELARALGRHPGVSRVELVTRLVDDDSVHQAYRMPREVIGEKAEIVRLAFGPARYIRKESLWNHVDGLVDRCTEYLRKRDRLPDVIHSHYADAGAAGTRLAQLFGIPLIHTGHSLGRTKRSRLLAVGRSEPALERQFNFRLRIAAEEETLDEACLVIASTRQEIEDQWGAYEHFSRTRSVVIPPGVDTQRFSPPRHGRRKTADPVLDRFFCDPHKPLILAIARPAPKKNLFGLLEAYGRDQDLRRMANLAIVAGTRQQIGECEETAKDVLSELLFGIDMFDLWGSVALPKTHGPGDVPRFYQTAAIRKGVFVNVALTEPFGLTLLEAAASGLPVVATTDGGPRDIARNCRHTVLVEPADRESIAREIRRLLGEPDRWRNLSRNGPRGVKAHYSWDAHAQRYVREVNRIIYKERKRMRRLGSQSPVPLPGRLHDVSSIVICDIDDTLVGNAESLKDLLGWLGERSTSIAFGIGTGRNLARALSILEEWGVPIPDILITSVGTEIFYGPDLRPDTIWERHIRHHWRREALLEALRDLPGLALQEASKQGKFKLSFDVDSRKMPSLESIQRLLRSVGLPARLVFSQGRFLDVLPVWASKGLAIRFLAKRLDLSLDHFLVAGDSGNDIEMLRGDTLAVVVANYKPEVEFLKGSERVFFAPSPYAAGILEGIRHYGFGDAPEAES